MKSQLSAPKCNFGASKSNDYLKENIVHKENLTYSEAIEMVMKDNGGFSSLKYIYENIEKYRKKTGKTPDN